MSAPLNDYDALMRGWALLVHTAAIERNAVLRRQMEDTARHLRDMAREGRWMTSHAIAAVQQERAP